MSFPSIDLNVPTEAFDESLREALAMVDHLKAMAASGRLGRDGSFTVDHVVVPLEEWRMYVPEVDVALTLAGDPFYTGPFSKGLLSNCRLAESRPRPAKFVLPADRLSGRPLGEFVAMSRRRVDEAWVTLKRY